MEKPSKSDASLSLWKRAAKASGKSSVDAAGAGGASSSSGTSTMFALMNPLIMAVYGTAFQASFTHCTMVGYEARRIRPVAVKLLSPLFIQSSQMSRSSALKHLLTEMSRGWSSLVRPPGMTAGMESVARILSFVTSPALSRGQAWSSSVRKILQAA